MSELASFLYDFISPVTGELSSYKQIPKAEYGEILMADENGYFAPSLSLIDAKIDINYLTKICEGIREASVIVQKPTDYFINEQALSLLDNGYMVKGDDGVISTSTVIPPELLSLPQGKLFIGNENNVATPSQIISIENLPNLYVGTVTGLELPAGKIWRGTSSYRPEESDALSIVEADILLINARFLLSNFIMGDALVQYAFPRAQYLSNILDQSLEGTILMKLGSRLKGATLTYNMVWKGNAEGFPQEAPYVSEERLQELVDEAQGFRDEAEGFAQEAEGFAGEAEGFAGEAGAAAAEATAAATEVATAVAGIGISVAAAAGSALAAGGFATTAGIYASEGEGYKNEALTAATESQANANEARTYYELLLATGINELPCTGDVNLHGYKIVELGNPTVGTDAVNKLTLDAAIAGIEPGIGQLDGFVETTTTTDGITHTVAGDLAKLSLIPAGGDVSLDGNRIKDLAYLPEDADDAVSASFLWDLLNNRIDDMIFRTQLDPMISVPDSLQSFNYSDQQSSAVFEIVSDFHPTSPSIPSNLKFDLINYASKGFRSGVLTKNTNSRPSYIFSYLEPTGSNENATITSYPLFTWNENQNDKFIFYREIQGIAPTSPSHLATSGWVTSQISSAISGTVTLQGDVTGSGQVGTNITTSLSAALTSSLATKTYVDNKTWPTSAITNFSSAVNTLIAATRLDQILSPNVPFNFGNQRLRNLGAPTETQDATTKSYVDSKRINELVEPNALVNFGNQRLYNLGAPVDGQDATHKSWVISYVASQIPGGTVSFAGDVSGSGAVGTTITTTLNKNLSQITVPSSDLNLNSKKIYSLADPVNNQDATTKLWVQNYVTSSTPSVLVGSFTPGICNNGGDDVIGDSGLGGQGYLARIGRYTKIGRFVHIEASIAFAGTPGCYNGDSPPVPIYFTGLPYAPNFTGVVSIPVYYQNLTNNNILSLFMNVSAVGTRYILNVIYQSSDTSANNGIVNIVRSNINKNQQTILSWSFSYTTNA